jgi:hypothetical protein
MGFAVIVQPILAATCRLKSQTSVRNSGDSVEACVTTGAAGLLADNGTSKGMVGAISI